MHIDCKSSTIHKNTQGLFWANIDRLSLIVAQLISRNTRVKGYFAMLIIGVVTMWYRCGKETAERKTGGWLQEKFRWIIYLCEVQSFRWGRVACCSAGVLRNYFCKLLFGHLATTDLK